LDRRQGAVKIRVKASKLVSICICASVAGLTTWFALSASFRAAVYRAVPYVGSYSTYDRLADSLRLGMSADEAGKILGRPHQQENLGSGERWTFFDDGPTAEWTCVVDFSYEAGKLRLAYFFNVQHRVFTNSLHRELGSPVDGGEFRSDPFLKMRRDQWHKGARSNQAASGNGAITLLFHARRPQRAVPEQRC